MRLKRNKLLVGLLLVSLILLVGCDTSVPIKSGVGCNYYVDLLENNSYINEDVNSNDLRNIVDVYCLKVCNSVGRVYSLEYKCSEITDQLVCTCKTKYKSKPIETKSDWLGDFKDGLL